MTNRSPGAKPAPNLPAGHTAGDLYRLLISSVRDYAIFVLDPEGRIASWNPGAERIKRYREEEIIGQHYRVFYPQEMRDERVPERQLEVAAEVGRFEGEGWRLRKDGTRFWAHVVITALYEGDQLVGFGKVTGDMTEERDVRESLRTRERQLAEAQQIAHLGSWEWDVATDTISWSEELFRIFGIAPETRLDFGAYFDRVHPEDRDDVGRRIAAARDSGTGFLFEHRIMRPDGSERWIQSRGETFRDDSGAIARMHGTALDITELKQAEQRARELTAERLAREEAERTARRMGFLAEASGLVGTSLDYEETLRTVAWLAVPSFADWCAVDIVEPDGLVHRLATAHVDPERVALAREIQERWPPDPAADTGVARVIRTGEAEIHEQITPEVIDAAARDDEHRRLLRQIGFHSAIITPIRVRERSLGAITFVNAESARTYGEDDVIVAQELASRAALAIENAQLHSAERTARALAERAIERITRLQTITAELSEAVTPAAVASAIVDGGVAALGASHGSLGLLQPDDTVEVIRSVGLPPGVLDAYRSFELDAGLPMAEAIRTGELVLVPGAADAQERFPGLARVLPLMTSHALAAVPLFAGTRVIGALGFGYAEPRDFQADDRDFLLALGRQCAQALERARLYETEHIAREAAEAASQAKSQFVAMMSHELRTPLSAIIGYQELLAEGVVGPVTDTQKEQLRRIRASATHLRDLINQILSLSRIEAGKEELFPEPFDLAGLTRDVVVLMEQEVEAKGLTLRVDVPEGEVELNTDPGKIRQILLNLLSNAVKFTERGSIVVELSAGETEVQLRVRDTGIGIEGSDLTRIFDPFTQVDQSMTRRAGGTGLGLPVSRHLAKLLGGSLDVESRPGDGSTFTLTIPRDRG